MKAGKREQSVKTLFNALDTFLTLANKEKKIINQNVHS